MSGATLDDAYTISKLPRPSESTPDSIRAAPVHSLINSKKRKRHEVAVGVDGEAVNIYNVQSQTLVASYALPPQSRLATAPCSIYCKHGQPKQTRRQTYIILRDGGRSKRLRLISFVEEQERLSGAKHELRTPNKQELKLRHHDVVAIETCGDSEDDTPSLVVQYKNGDVDRVAGDLSRTIWEHAVASSEDGSVEFACVTGFEAARKGLLRSQADALLSTDAAASTQLLCQVLKIGTATRFRAFRFAATSSNLLRGQSSPLEMLLEYDLPSRTRHAGDSAEYEVHASTGLLYQRLNGRLTVFNLCKAIPRVEAKFGRKADMRITSFVRLSSASVFTVSSEKWSIIETKYGASLVTKSIDNTVNNAAASLELCCYYSDLGLLVGLRGTELVALQLGGNLQNKKSLDRGPLLADIVNSNKLPAGMLAERVATKSRSSQKWEQWKTVIDKYVDDKDVVSLEQQIAADLGLDDPDSMDVDESKNAATERQAMTWDLASAPYDANTVDSKKALYLLSKMVVWRRVGSDTADETYAPEFAIKSRNIIRWLAIAGYLSASQIETAVPKPAGVYTARIAPGDVMKAVYKFDPGFWLTCELLALPVHWQLAEVVQTLKLLIQSLNVAPEDDSLATTAAPIQVDPDTDMVDGDVDLQFEAEVAAAARELDYASSVFDFGLRARSEALRLLIARLDGFASDDIIQQLRSTMSTDETVFLVAILRIELRDGGWTSRHIADERDEAEKLMRESLGNAEQLTASDQALRTIARLLNCCVDAIGVSGWLVGRSGQDMGTEALIETIRAEISAALEGCYEAAAVSQCLDDIIRLAGSDDLLNRRSNAEQAVSIDQTIMPLGGRVLRSKEGKKSRAALAIERSRAIGKYTFEQIRF